MCLGRLCCVPGKKIFPSSYVPAVFTVVVTRESGGCFCLSSQNALTPEIRRAARRLVLVAHRLSEVSMLLGIVHPRLSLAGFVLVLLRPITCFRKVKPSLRGKFSILDVRYGRCLKPAACTEDWSSKFQLCDTLSFRS